jgi:hypothetical protein
VNTSALAAPFFTSHTSSSPLFVEVCSSSLSSLVDRYRPKASVVLERLFATSSRPTDDQVTPRMTLRSGDASSDENDQAFLATDPRAIIAQLRARG